MSFNCYFLILLLCGLMAAAEDINRVVRQADFDFPGPRRTPATLPVFGSDGEEGGGGGRGGRPRSRPSFRPEESSGEESLGGGGGGGLDDLGGGGFRPHPPPRSFRPPPSERPSGGVGGGRFSSRPSFGSDSSNEADFGGTSKGKATSLNEEEVAEEEKKPDRLTLLLQESKFQCSEKKPGYYADDGLSCEVFHYCNEGVKHSWMCPAGTSFHQIHLICMQEGGDNICKQSTKYHFVNDYLYKALPDSSRNPNGTLRYADRYFPEEDGQRVEEDHRAPPQKQHTPSFQAEPEEQFFQQPPSHHSSGGGRGGGGDTGGRFRPNFDENQFLLPPPNFSTGRGGHGGSGGSGEDFGGSEENRFQPTSQSTSPPARVRDRSRQPPRFQF